MIPDVHTGGNSETRESAQNIIGSTTTAISGEQRSVGRRNSTGVDEGRNGSCLLAIKMPSKARTAAGRGEGSLLCGPGSELRVGGRKKRRAKLHG